jgi:RIO-like serine/threonine protein kinase
VGGIQFLVHHKSAMGGMPRIGQELGRGSEGVVYENLDQPGWVVKEFHRGGTSPFQAGNEFQNLEIARAIRPDNVVKAQAPADPQQGFLVKERVLPTDVPEDLAQKAQVLQEFLPQIQDAGGNLIWGTTVDNPTPRWILIE